MPPEPSQVPVSPLPDPAARQRLHIHGIREMPAGYDAEVAELFRDLRSASNLSEADLAARLATRVEVVQALEQGALYALPPWAETCRVVNGYGAMLNLDVRPLLRRIYAQLETGIVELSPKPIPDVPTMAPPESNGLDPNPFETNQFENPFAGSNFGTNAFQGNSFGQRPAEPSKTAAPKPASPIPGDWPDNPFAKPKPAQPQAAPQKQPQAAPQKQPQWPQAQPAPSPQQNSWPGGPGSQFQTTWPNAAPQAPAPPAPQAGRPMAPSPQPPQRPQAPWTGNSGAQQRPVPQLPQGQGQPRPQQQRPPQQAKMPPQPPRPAPQPQTDAAFEGGWQQPSGPKHPTEADLEAAWQQPGQPKPQPRARPQAAPSSPPLPVEAPEKPRRKRALLKWGIVLLLLAIMTVGGWLVLGHFKGQVGFQSSKPAALDPDDPRSHKADKLPSPAQGPS
jgi:hypothetical protein